MREEHRQVAGLHTCLVPTAHAPRLMIVFLHGYGMRAADLAPFAHSLSIPGVAYAFPQAPTPTPAGGYAWWPAVGAEGATRAQCGARDLADEEPAGRAPARAAIRALLNELCEETAAPSVILAGFSQGGMLACDTVLFETVQVDGLALMSSSCIAIDEWQGRAHKLRGLRVFVSHGRADEDLAFAAGQRLQQFLQASAPQVTWAPFDGGHEIPFSVWRQFRYFILDTLQSTTPRKTPPHGIH